MMLKNYFFILMRFLVISALLFSCNNDLQEEIVTFEKTKPKAAQKKTDKVSEAIDFLNEAFVDKALQTAAPGSTPQTVNFSKSKIDTIYDLPDEKNKPFLKLVIFKPKAYALVSVIKNVPNPPVLYYSDNKFDVKKPPIGLIIYLQQFTETATRSYIAPDPDGPDKSFTIYTTTLSVKHVKNEVLPLLKTYWGQWSPYNNTIIKKKKKQYFPVGCVAVAVGQIMAYHKKNNLKSYNWSKILDINTKKIDQSGGVADFLWDVAEGVNTQYGLKGSDGSVGSGASSKNDAVPYFKRAGYKACYADYKYATVINELKQKRPVYLGADSGRTYNGWFWSLLGQPYTYSGGHAWVCDGYIERKYTRTFRKDIYDNINKRIAYSYTDTEGFVREYLHMNWGLKGKNKMDGWCTYNYWRLDADIYKYRKEMITVKP